MSDRVIEFRLIKEGQVVGYERHKRTRHGRMMMQQSITGKNWNVICVGPIANYWIDHDKKEQFTGAMDESDKKIYVGDIVEYIEEPFGPMVGVVEYIEYSCAYWIHNKSESAAVWLYETFGNDKTLEVVGNIHDNPELMEGEK